MKLFTHLLLLALAAGTFASAAMAADAPIVREIYTCNLNDGKDMDDLMDARDFYLKQMDKAGLEAANAFVWTPFKAPVDFDFLWFNDQGSMMDYAKSTDAFNASAEAQAAMERFNSVATCTSNLAMRRQTYQAAGELNLGTGPALIGAFACNYLPGRGPGDLDDLLGHISGAIGSIDLEDGALGFASVPGVGAGPNAADVYFYNVNSSMEAWATRNMAFQASPETPSLMRHLQAVVDCNGALFHGMRVVPPVE